MGIKYPDYDDSLLSVISSIMKHYGADCGHKPLACLDKLLGKNYKNVVVMLFDGMGSKLLGKHLDKGSFLLRNTVKTISSVFPPTTTAATMSIETGLSPIEHGWLGWSLYFKEIGANVSIFPNTLSGTNGLPAADYHLARKHIPYKSAFEKIKEATGGSVEAITVSFFSEYQIKSVDEICNTVKTLCNKNGGRRKYIYTYWHQPDSVIHEFGVSHERASAGIKDIDRQVGALCAELTDTLVIVTADHGLKDTGWLYLTDYPDILECLSGRPSIESRAQAFPVKPKKRKQFEIAFSKHFGDFYLLYTKEEALKAGLFGQGTPHPRAYGFLGDYLAIATGDISLEYSPSIEHDVFKAAHAGMTDDEMNVPFIAIECK